MRFPTFMLVVLCAVLWFAADSHAFTPASSPHVERYERIATSYWGDVPDCDQVEYVWSTTDPFGRTDALAWAGGCQVWFVYWEPLKGGVLDRYASYTTNCFTFVHEWGHLLGFHHDAAGYAGGGLYDACAAAALVRYPSASPAVSLEAGKPPRTHRKPDPYPRRKRRKPDPWPGRPQATWTQHFDDSGSVSDRLRRR